MYSNSSKGTNVHVERACIIITLLNSTYIFEVKPENPVSVCTIKVLCRTMHRAQNENEPCVI